MPDKCFIRIKIDVKNNFQCSHIYLRRRGYRREGKKGKKSEREQKLETGLVNEKKGNERERTEREGKDMEGRRREGEGSEEKRRKLKQKKGKIEEEKNGTI